MLDGGIVTVIAGFLPLPLSSQYRQTRSTGIDCVQYRLQTTARTGCLLVGLWYGDNHNDGTCPGEEREEAKYPTPMYTSNSHIPSNQGRNLSNTVSEGCTLNGERSLRLTVGPATGPMAKNDRAFPRVSGAHKSLAMALKRPMSVEYQRRTTKRTHPGNGR